MLVGHFAVGLAAKRVEPRISLGTLILSAMLADLLCFVFLIAGIEHFESVPGATLNRAVGHDIAYSHSLLMDVIWPALSPPHISCEGSTLATHWSFSSRC